MKKDKIDNIALNEFIHLSNKVLKIFLFLLAISLVLITTYVIKEWQIFTFIKTILVVISPVFIGFIIAWLLDPLATKLSKKMPRVLACILSYLLMIVLITLIIILVVPSFGSGIGEIVNTLPKIVDNLKNIITDFFDNFKDNALIFNYKKDILTNMETMAKNFTETFPQTMFDIVKKLLSGGTNFVLGLMIGFYLLFDFNKFQGHVLSLLPNRWHKNAKDLMKRINGKLRNYLQGVLIVMLLVFFTQSIGLALAGLKAPIVFALFCAITDIIPYVGPWIGGVPAVIIGFAASPMTGVLTLISIIVCQTLENNFYQPLIMGKTMQLHPVTIMLGLLLFSYFFGMIGMIVATPVIAVLKIIFEFIDEKTSFWKTLQDYSNTIKEETMTKKSTNKKRVKES